jgi:hypothetical protein
MNAVARNVLPEHRHECKHEAIAASAKIRLRLVDTHDSIRRDNDTDA